MSSTSPLCIKRLAVEAFSGSDLHRPAWGVRWPVLLRMLTSSGGTVVAGFYGAVDATLEEVAMRVQRVLLPDGFGGQPWSGCGRGGDGSASF